MVIVAELFNVSYDKKIINNYRSPLLVKDQIAVSIDKY